MHPLLPLSRAHLPLASRLVLGIPDLDQSEPFSAHATGIGYLKAALPVRLS